MSRNKLNEKRRSSMAKILGGEELERRCRELGVDTQGTPRTQSSSGSSPRASDYELQRRLIEAERSIRENRLWLVALMSAIASVISAGAALFALYMSK
ncbi:MAG: hypothetical protein KGJ49_12940 [Alphaproteobacteria bacterium]|nr:hypothetical protein [Alphaproteobacteria bacterium]